MPKLVVVSTTVSDGEQADKMAGAILSSALGACVQTSEVISRYFWEGKLCEEKEFLLQVKTTELCANKLQEFITANHPYKVPEVLVFPVISASASYAKWVSEQISPEFS